MNKRIMYGGALVMFAALACMLAGSAAAGAYASAPTITNFTPKSGTSGTKVTITGENLQGAAVTFAYSPGTISSIAADGTKLVAVVPAEAQAGPNHISITTSTGTVMTPSVFTVIGAKPHPPQISTFTPTHGKTGTRVQIKGNYFNSAKTVKFGGVNTPFKIRSANYILATVSAKSKSGKITVTSPSGTKVSAKSFAVTGR